MRSLSLNFLRIFRRLSRMKFSTIFPPYANFDPFSTIFEIKLNTFSCRFRAAEVTSSLIFSKIPAVFLESSTKISNFLKTSKHSNFTTKIPKILFGYHKQTIFLRILRRLFQKSNCANYSNQHDFSYLPNYFDNIYPSFPKMKLSLMQISIHF